MAYDSMSDSCLFQLEKYFNSNPYREYVMNKPYIPLSAHSNRLKKSSSMAFHQFINKKKTPLTLDRINYKLRMKSNLNVDTLRESRNHCHTNTPINDSVQCVSRATTIKTFLRQPTSISRTTNSMKTEVNEEFNGIEGNAVHVGTINDLIKHFHQEEVRLIHRATDYLDNLAISTSSNNRLINERTTFKSPAFASERIIKQPQALTEYHLKVPNSSSKTYQNHKIKKPLVLDLNSLKQQSISKRIQEPRVKTFLHTEKQGSICNKLTIINPFNFEDNHHRRPILPSSRYIFPPVRAFGYFTRKSTDEMTPVTPLLMRKKQEIKKIPKNSLDSIDQLSIVTNHNNSPISTDINKSITSLSDLDDDDLSNPPNTRINVDFK